MRPAPAPTVLTWVTGHRSGDLSTTAITVAEIRYGLARLPDGHRKDVLVQAAGEVFATFPAQVLPFDLAAADAYADLVSHRDRVGTPIDGFDAQIAAICRIRGATLATRDIKDFADVGVTTTNPWLQPGPR